jgi:hypothetical protein
MGGFFIATQWIKIDIAAYFCYAFFTKAYAVVIAILAIDRND